MNNLQQQFGDQQFSNQYQLVNGVLMHTENRAIVSLLDDYQNNCPLRGDLGNRPDEWLDLRGCGLMKIAG